MLPCSGWTASKTQGEEIPNRERTAGGRDRQPGRAARANAIPPGQSRTKKWPVLDASGPPEIDLARWRFRMGGLVGQEVEWSWEEFRKLAARQGFRRFSLRDALVAAGQSLGRCLDPRPAATWRAARDRRPAS